MKKNLNFLANPKNRVGQKKSTQRRTKSNQRRGISQNLNFKLAEIFVPLPQVRIF